MESGYYGGKINSTCSQKYPSFWASQLRSSRVATVDALVRLGQQLERDRGETRAKEKNIAASVIQNLESPPPPPQQLAWKLSQQFCWRCKGDRPPARRPNYSPGHNNFNKSAKRNPEADHPFESKAGVHSHGPGPYTATSPTLPVPDFTASSHIPSNWWYHCQLVGWLTRELWTRGQCTPCLMGGSETVWNERSILDRWTLVLGRWMSESALWGGGGGQIQWPHTHWTLLFTIVHGPHNHWPWPLRPWLSRPFWTLIFSSISVLLIYDMLTTAACIKLIKKVKHSFLNDHPCVSDRRVWDWISVLPSCRAPLTSLTHQPDWCESAASGHKGCSAVYGEKQTPQAATGKQSGVYLCDLWGHCLCLWSLPLRFAWGSSCFVYLDVIIYLPSLQQHFPNIQAVMDKLSLANREHKEKTLLQDLYQVPGTCGFCCRDPSGSGKDKGSGAISHANQPQVTTKVSGYEWLGPQIRSKLLTDHWISEHPKKKRRKIKMVSRVSDGFWNTETTSGLPSHLGTSKFPVAVCGVNWHQWSRSWGWGSPTEYHPR